MDGNRFDGLTRIVARGIGRRALVRTMAGAVLGAAIAGRRIEEAAAACSRHSRPCGTGCCPGLTCVGGRCGCAAGQQVCHSNTGPICIKPCAADQVLGSGCRCLCRNSGRPPVNGLCCTPADAIPTELPCCEGLDVDDQGVCTTPQCVELGQPCGSAAECCGAIGTVSCEAVEESLSCCLVAGQPCYAAQLPSFDSTCCNGCCIENGLGGVCNDIFNICT